jgi:two-component system LytT family sensor kinase
LSVEFQVPDNLRGAVLPAFVLQPLVENAVKHGIAQTFGSGVIRISACQEGECLVLSVEDNAGLYGDPSPSAGEGLGLGLVRQRLRSIYGTDGGVTLSCLPNRWTKATLSVPFSVHFPACEREIAA